MSRNETAREAELQERARGLVGVISEDAPVAERDGQLTDRTVEAFHDADLVGIWVPQSLGGSELRPSAGARVIETISYADPSAGWVLLAAMMVDAITGAYVGDEAVAELFAHERMPQIHGQGTRAGVAVPQDGGFLCSGSWSFGSGIKHAQYAHGLVRVDGSDEPLIYTVPIDQVRLDWDSWDVLGLRATGSLDYAFDDVFVPRPWTFPAAAESSERGGPLYRLGVMGFICICHGAWTLGVGRRLLDELNASLIRPDGRAASQARSDAFLEKYADAEGAWQASRAFYYEVWNALEDKLYGGDELTQADLTRMRLAVTHTTWAIDAVATFVYQAVGSEAIRAGTIQRLYRDMITGGSHITSAPMVRQNIGRMLTDPGAGKRWVFLSLV